MDDTRENKIKISVRNLVEFILRCGDLDSRFMGSSRAVEGTRAHQKIQKESKEGYLAEVALKYSTSYKSFTFEIEGRADGIIINENSITIDEIKTTGRPINLI
jgi:hypothetical protein